MEGKNTVICLDRVSVITSGRFLGLVVYPVEPAWFFASGVSQVNENAWKPYVISLSAKRGFLEP